MKFKPAVLLLSHLGFNLVLHEVGEDVTRAYCIASDVVLGHLEGKGFRETRNAVLLSVKREQECNRGRGRKGIRQKQTNSTGEGGGRV